MITVFTKNLSAKETIEYAEAFISFKEMLSTENCSSKLIYDIDNVIEYLTYACVIKREKEKQKEKEE